MSDTFEQDGNIIYYGDATDIISKRIPSSSIDLIFADPPYNIGKKFANFKDHWPSLESYLSWAYKWIDECIRVLKSDGTMYVMTSTQAMPYFDLYIRNKLTILSRIVWFYDSSGVQARNFFGSMYEPILHCVKDAKRYKFNAAAIKIEARTGSQRKLIDYRKTIPSNYNNEKVPGNVWYFHRVRYRMPEYEEHPSQKPEKLLDRIILASSDAGDTILDPFAGTFTAAAVCKQLNRNSISIESQEEYLKIGLRRVFGYKTFNGEKLSPPKKSYVRKNGRHQGQSPQSGELFDDLR